MSAFDEMNDLNKSLRRGVALNSKLDVVKANGVIEGIQKKSASGGCVPEDIVNASRSPKAPLHNLFEWEDSIAAERYRYEQARYILRTVRIKYNVIVNDEVTTKQIRHQVSVPSKENNKTRIYVPLPTAMADRDWRDSVLMDALNGLRHWRRRWAELNEYADAYDVLHHVDQALAAMMELAASTGTCTTEVKRPVAKKRASSPKKSAKKKGPRKRKQ